MFQVYRPVRAGDRSLAGSTGDAGSELASSTQASLAEQSADRQPAACRGPARPDCGPIIGRVHGSRKDTTTTALRRLPHPSLLVGTLLLAGTSPALAAPDTQCRRVNATGIGQAGPDGVGTTAVITRDGLLKGATAATFQVTGAPPVLASDGDIVFTTHHGTPTLTVTGTLDVGTGAFPATGPVTSGTDRFAGATGSLTATGTQDVVSGAFTEVVTGTVCLDKHD